MDAKLRRPICCEKKVFSGGALILEYVDGEDLPSPRKCGCSQKILHLKRIEPDKLKSREGDLCKNGYPSRLKTRKGGLVKNYGFLKERGYIPQENILHSLVSQSSYSPSKSKI